MDRPAGAPAFSEELRALAAQFGNRPASLGELLEATRGRGYHLGLFVIALPFVGPVPLPGLSIPFGLAVAAIGARMAVNRAPWLPPRLLRIELPARLLVRTLNGAGHLVAFLETVARPRLVRLNRSESCQRLGGVMITLSGLFLALPLPLPFSNSLPAWTVLFLTAGALAGDGIMILGGWLAFAVSVAFFAFVAIGGGHLILRLLPH